MAKQKAVFRSAASVVGTPTNSGNKLAGVMTLLGLDPDDKDIRAMFAEKVTESLCKMTPQQLNKALQFISNANNASIAPQGELEANAADQIALAASLPETFAPVPCVLTQEQIDRKNTERTSREIHSRIRGLRRQALHNDDEHTTPAPKILLP